jgi:hypothetical protein
MGRPIGGIPSLLAPDAFDVSFAVDIQILIKHADSCLQRAKKLKSNASPPTISSPLSFFFHPRRSPQT